MTNLRHLSFPADKITAKMANQFIQTVPRTFDWQQPFTCLWCWLPLRLSKRQSPLPTIVLIRTKFTHTIKLHYYILLYYNLVAFACREWPCDKVCELSRSKCPNIKQKSFCNFVKEPMYRRQRQLRENKLMRLYPFVGPISNVITLKLFLDLGIWSSETNVHLLSVLLDVSVKNA